MRDSFYQFEPLKNSHTHGRAVRVTDGLRLKVEIVAEGTREAVSAALRLLRDQAR